MRELVLFALGAGLGGCATLDSGQCVQAVEHAFRDLAACGSIVSVAATFSPDMGTTDKVGAEAIPTAVCASGIAHAVADLKPCRNKQAPHDAGAGD